MEAIDWSRTYNADLHPGGFTSPAQAWTVAKLAGYDGYVLDGRYYPVDAPDGAAPQTILDLPRPVVDHDGDALTIAVTFGWQRPWALDHCEAGVIVGEARRALVAHFKGYEQLRGILDVVCWEPHEERILGRRNGAPQPALFDR